MFIQEYISKDFPAFDINDSIEEAAEMAREFSYSHVFVTRNSSFLGAISQAFLEESPEGSLQTLEIHFERFAVLEDGHLLDTIKLFHIFNSNLVPVIDREERYLGYISCDDVFSEFSKYPLFSENGAVIIVQKNARDYSFSEISKIVEENNAKIFGSFISAVEGDDVQITLKISSDHLSSIDETFERYGYEVVVKHYDDEKEELLKARFGFFQKYLEF
ncbi:MAG: CBS domain-containing protein [Chryseobacterium sp.]|nr:CBS domain-containing protein [Chryseobacterium sp.]